MYKLTADYHTHTTMSHGINTPEDNVRAGIRAGLEAIAISDHSVNHMAYGIRSVENYLAEIQRLKEAYAPQIKVLSGIELNLISLTGGFDLPGGYLEEFDIKIMGFHKLARMRDFPSFMHFYPGRLMGQGKSYVARTTDAYIKALSSGRLHILAHPGYAIAIDISAVAQACREYNVLFEINNSHGQFSEQNLETAAKENPKFVLSSDAHQAAGVGHCENALQKALNVGLSHKEIVNIRQVGGAS